jgi:hypothetical protein
METVRRSFHPAMKFSVCVIEGPYATCRLKPTGKDQATYYLSVESNTRSLRRLPEDMKNRF